MTSSYSARRTRSSSKAPGCGLRGDLLSNALQYSFALATPRLSIVGPGKLGAQQPSTAQQVRTFAHVLAMSVYFLSAIARELCVPSRVYATAVPS